MTTLLHISGGLDSVYTAYIWLKNNSTNKILLHHVNLQHREEDRLEEETKAMSEVLDWFKNNGLDNFEYRESTLLYGDLKGFIRDFMAISFFTAAILKEFRFIDTILSTRHAQENNLTEEQRNEMIFSILKPLGIKRDIKFDYPNGQTNRKDMFENMPLDLYKLCKSCRKPIQGKPCKRCRTCKQFITLGINPI